MTKEDRVDDFKEKIRSLSLMGDRADRSPKVTTDVHDTHTVDVVEHWSDRQDVTVTPDPVRVRMTQES